MRIVLVMAKTYHTPIDVWLDMTLEKLFEWVVIADMMAQEERQKGNTQNVGPGF